MKHRRIQKLLSAYIDDKLNLKERQEIEMHIHTCDECADILSEFKQNSQWIADLRQPTPLRIWEAIQEQIISGQQTKNRSRFSRIRHRWGFRPVSAVVGTFVTACLVLALVYLNPNQNYLDDPIDLYVEIHTDYEIHNLVTQNTNVNQPFEKTEPELPEETEIFLDAHFGD
jgi:anti-sigma-K factor RskA